MVAELGLQALAVLEWSYSCDSTSPRHATTSKAVQLSFTINRYKVHFQKRSNQNTYITHKRIHLKVGMVLHCFSFTWKANYTHKVPPFPLRNPAGLIWKQTNHVSSTISFNVFPIYRCTTHSWLPDNIAWHLSSSISYILMLNGQTSGTCSRSVAYLFFLYAIPRTIQPCLNITD